ncbi:hypothetical protein [Williamsia sp.]|uniref:hypothetical protein n=1 Tax=Williamsia sp. TaxID=1872085 RepID=UPI002F927718
MPFERVSPDLVGRGVEVAITGRATELDRDRDYVELGRVVPFALDVDHHAPDIFEICEALGFDPQVVEVAPRVSLQVVVDVGHPVGRQALAHV